MTQKTCDHCGEPYEGIGVGVDHVVAYDGDNHNVMWHFCSDRCRTACKDGGYLDEVEPDYFLYMSSEEYGTERFGPYDSEQEAYEAEDRVRDSARALKDGVHRSFWVSTDPADQY